jgi:uncharacterized protein (TIGR02246 family)
MSQQTTVPDARRLAEGYTQAWCSHQPEAVAAFYTEDGRIAVNGGEPSRGRSGVADMARAFYDDFPDLEVKMDGVRSSGTHAVYLWTLLGTHAKTGNRVEVEGWEYWLLGEDGLIAESLGHFDADEYQRQVDGEGSP